MLLNAYDTSADTAIAVLEADGWIYNKDGEAYTEGVRYKKIPAEYADENDKTYKSIDGAYVTTKVGDDYYMPLVLNWYGTTDNPFSDLLVTDFEQGTNIAAAGFVIQKTTGDFARCSTSSISRLCTASIPAPRCTAASTMQPASPPLHTTTLQLVHRSLLLCEQLRCLSDGRGRYLLAELMAAGP